MRAASEPRTEAATRWCRISLYKRKTMIKTLDFITETIRSNHPFRKVADRPQKEQKHRYERRKVREFIKLGDWRPEAT